MAEGVTCSMPVHQFTQSLPDPPMLAENLLRATIENKDSEDVFSSPPSHLPSASTTPYTPFFYNSRRNLTPQPPPSAPQQTLNQARKKLRQTLPLTHAFHTRVCHATGTLHPLQSNGEPRLPVLPPSHPKSKFRPRKGRKDMSDPDYALDRARLIRMWNHDWTRDEDWRQWEKCEAKMAKLKRKFRLAEIEKRRDVGRVEKPKKKKRTMEHERRGVEESGKERGKSMGEIPLAQKTELPSVLQEGSLPFQTASMSMARPAELEEQYAGDYSGLRSAQHLQAWIKAMGGAQSNQLTTLSNVDGANDADSEDAEDKSIAWEDVIDPALLAT